MKSQLRMLVPNAYCGILIGKEGETIKRFIQDSNAQIRVANTDMMVLGLHER